MTNIMLDAHDFTLAHEILGDDFISPEEIAAVCGFAYSKDQVADLERILPDKETLEWLKRNDFMLVAGPSYEMSFLDVYKFEWTVNFGECSWYTEFCEEPFVCDEKLTCCWYMIRKNIVPNSTYKTWGEQQRLLSNFERVPTAVELVWGMICYKAVRNVYLLEDLFAHTSSVAFGDDHVSIGYFDGSGFDVRCWLDGARHVRHGICSARKS
jgi:hypothetical protein